MDAPGTPPDIQTDILFVCDPLRADYVSDVRACLERGGWQCALTAPDAWTEAASDTRARLVVTVHSTKPELASAFAALRARGIPSLTLQDGIIEHRHAAHGAGGRVRYRPLATDALAVFGQGSADIAASWGVARDRLHVTGAPRFAAPEPDEGVAPGSGLLLTTANRPTHTRRELAKLYRLMARVLDACEVLGVPVRYRPGRSLVPGRMNAPDTLEGRLEPELAERLCALPVSRGPLTGDLRAARAVLTTPSTVALEAMALGRPTGHLEFDDETIYLPVPWRARRGSDLERVVAEMMDPPPLKMAFQEATLAYQLERDDPLGRTVRLIEAMALPADAGARP